MNHVKVISFTDAGKALADRIYRELSGIMVQRYARGVDPSLQHTQLRRLAQQSMFDCEGLIFIGAAGIAVRAVAPFLRGKADDPAVIVLDERGQFVIPLLSGHLGGANALAGRIATALDATAVITTATDVNEVFAVDSWARAHGFHVWETGCIRHISAALLRGDTVGLQSDFPLTGALPPGVSTEGAQESGIVLSVRTDLAPYAHTLHLIPRTVWVGIGCRRDTPLAALETLLCEILRREHIPLVALCGLATIDIKKEEPGLLALAQKYRLPLQCYSAAQLRQTAGQFTGSAFVQQTVGVDNVCERAAALASGGALLCGKTALDGVTIALAAEKREVHFS